MEERGHKKDWTLRLFVYGTLKRGFSNHESFCGNALDIAEAAIHGDLYDLPFGFPALVVPSKSIRAFGTTSYALDTTEQHRLNASASKSAPRGGSKVLGEIFTFDDPVERLPKLDRLEGFDPDGSSLYRRVLVPVETEDKIALAWAYAAEKPAGEYLPTGRWPS